MRPIIKAQGLGKQYHIGTRGAGYSTLRETLVGATRSSLRAFRRNGSSAEQTIWALRDVSFDVNPGEVVGIIGRNGAGKSTLLKILSRITEPTTGKVELYGRVGSLLEVGTGFHPELTGRENIFLNGSILGMRRTEIEAKFDEIVAFAEIEKFIDTPVKRYSSGMYVRLAFAVAAHLEPEILVVDEVLSVGDMAFQQKCLGKMGEVVEKGRTVLFVSHNMGAISRLCQRCLLLDQGRIVEAGLTGSVVQTYMTSGIAEQAEYVQKSAPTKDISLLRVSLLGSDLKPRTDIAYHEPLRFRIDYEVNKPVTGTSVGLAVFNVDGTCAFETGDFDAHQHLLRERSPANYRTEVEIPGQWLNPGRYTVRLYIANANTGVVYDSVEAIIFNIIDTGSPGSLNGVQRRGVLQPVLDWQTVRKNK
jgi:lipopolysaccharide transport system ATP-binding protein